MSILRFAARSLLASFFIAEGAQAAKDPDPRLPAAEKFTSAMLPLAPSAVSEYLPEDPRTWARLTGVAQIVGGVGLALGIARRPSALVLAATMVPAVISRPVKALPEEERSTARALQARNLGLLGAAFLAALDTEGRPNMAWRAAHAKRRLTKEGRKQKRNAKKTVGRIQRQASAVAREAKSMVTG